MSFNSLDREECRNLLHYVLGNVLRIGLHFGVSMSDPRFEPGSEALFVEVGGIFLDDRWVDCRAVFTCKDLRSWPAVDVLENVATRISQAARDVVAESRKLGQEAVLIA